MDRTENSRPTIIRPKLQNALEHSFSILTMLYMGIFYVDYDDHIPHATKNDP